MAQKIVIFASGEGSLFESLVQASKEGKIPGEISALLCNNSKANALKKAERCRIKTYLIPQKELSFERWDEGVRNILSKLDPQLIVLAGFLKKIGPQTLKSFPRIINTHPALLPKFGGEKMYGRRVHKAVLESGDKESGVTIHKVTAKYDEGPILVQKRIPISPEETLESLENKVKNEERVLLCKIIDDIFKGKVNL